MMETLWRSHTSNQPYFTLRVFICTAHHGPNCVVDHCYYVQVKLLLVRIHTHTHTHTHIVFHHTQTDIVYTGVMLLLGLDFCQGDVKQMVIIIYCNFGVKRLGASNRLIVSSYANNANSENCSVITSPHLTESRSPLKYAVVFWLTLRLLMASFSMSTTSFPSQSVAVKLFVQLTSFPYRTHKGWARLHKWFFTLFLTSISCKAALKDRSFVQWLITGCCCYDKEFCVVVQTKVNSRSRHALWCPKLPYQ